MKTDQLGRRSFLKSSALAGVSGFLTSWPVRGEESAAPLRFGLIADIHKDVMHDADQRLRSFIDDMKKRDVDFILQLGDFCVPKEGNKPFLEIWNTFEGGRYHVLGNHDTDGGYKREQTVAWWKMPSRYYSFDRGGVHFVVLDGNDVPKDHTGGYPCYIADDQQEWLQKDLAATKLATVVFVHQSIERESDGAIKNGGAIRKILEDANQSAGERKVVACFSGHHHRDYVRQIKNIVYPQINSASYYWVGGDYQKVRYSKEVDASHPYIKYTVPYKDPIYAIVTIDAARGFMQIEGKSSEFVGPAPWDLGKDRKAWDADTLRAEVSAWKMPIA